MSRDVGTPGGKVDDESPKDNILREIEEETGIQIADKDNNLTYVMKTFVIYPKYQFIYHVFRYNLDRMPKITLSDEHSEYKWMKLTDALKLNLVPDEDWCIKETFNLK